MRLALLRAALILSVTGVSVHSAPMLELEKAPRSPIPEVAAASDDAINALSRIQVAAGFEASLWAAEPMLANPVAFDFDERGRVFVSETHRYRTSVLDIRAYMAMLEQDLALRTVDDRAKMILELFGEKQANELSQETEVVRLIEDRDGDGVADHSSVFADGFNSSLDGIASGVIARNGKVWFTNIPSLWLLEGDSPTATQATKRTELLRGFGVRFGYTGHDFHGLAWGPDGKLYYSIGDRGTYVTTPEGHVITVPDEGAVFRSNPDGTEMEIVARGLRNPQELVFDEHGNLFTGDNDCDNGDLERLVYLVEGGDSGWRVGYQHAPLGKAGPWMRELLWLPRFPEQPAYLLPPICNIEDGPSGLTYYPGTGLTSDYRGTFFITHFKGSIVTSGVQTYTVRPDGAGFAPTSSSRFIGSALPTDVAFGPDGRFYFADWVEGWPKSTKGRIYAITPKTQDPLAAARLAEMKQLFADGMSGRDQEELLRLLAHPDQRIRQNAQFELADRGSPSVAALQALARSAQAQRFPRLHALWALGQIAHAQRSSDGLAPLPDLLRDLDPEVRAQSAKLLGDHRVTSAQAALVDRLQDEAARVQFFAVQSLGKLGRAEVAPELIELLRRNDDRDVYLRHAAVHALERLGPTPALAAAASDPSRAVRLGTLLVYRRLRDAAAGQFMRDVDPYIVREAARAINDAEIPGAFAALAARLEDAPLQDEALMLRVLNAHFRLGQPDNAAALTRFAVRSDAPEALRAEALTHLGAWGKPPARDRLVGVFRPLAPREAGPARDALRAHWATLLRQGPLSVREAALAAVRRLEVREAASELHALVAEPKAPAVLQAQALDVLDAFDDPQLLATVQLAGNSTIPQVRLAALPILARVAPREALPVIRRLIEGADREQRAAFLALSKLDLPETSEMLAHALQRLAEGKVAAAAQFDLLEVAEKSTAPQVQALLARQKETWATGTDPLAPFRGALTGGDHRKGADVFYDHPVMACVRCHKVSGSGGDAGPDLTTIATHRTPEHLLESIIKPSAEIAPGFDVVSVTLRNGQLESGTVLHETPEALTLRRPDDTEVVLTKADISGREAAPSSMPEIYAQVLTRAELRDLMTFLRRLNTTVAPPVNDGPRALRSGRPRGARGDEAVVLEEAAENEG